MKAFFSGEEVLVEGFGEEVLCHLDMETKISQFRFE
jgi:hypothetical protein